MVKRRQVCTTIAALAATGWATATRAHGTRAGDLTLDHPYATPSAPDGHTAFAYLRNIGNRGSASERLIGARTPIASAVQLQQRGATVAALEISAGASLKWRHDGDTRLQLVDLKQPLRNGDRFSLWLRFERAGEHEVNVWVQTPRERAGAAR